jgi:hypothetical protein
MYVMEFLVDLAATAARSFLLTIQVDTTGFVTTTS